MFCTYILTPLLKALREVCRVTFRVLQTVGYVERSLRRAYKRMAGC